MGRMRSAAGLAALVLATAVAAAGCGSAVGVVDTQRVLNESVKALQYQKQLDDREKQMAAELAVLAPQVSKAELAARRARLLTERGQMKADLEAKLNRQIMDAASEVARREGLRLVLVKGPTLLGGRDITQEVIDRLK
jgi:Skp family chaperone for outer membrane proteins